MGEVFHLPIIVHCLRLLIILLFGFIHR